MWRQIFRVIGSAYKMTIRLYRRWFVFGVSFVLFFYLFSLLMGVVLILPFIPVFGQWGFDFYRLAITSNKWWITEIMKTGSIGVVFAVGLFAAYMRKGESQASFRNFLRAVPSKAWRLFFLYCAAFILLGYTPTYFHTAFESNGITAYKWTAVCLEWLPLFFIYLAAGLVYMRAAGISRNGNYFRKLLIYQVTDMVISSSVTFLTVFLMALGYRTGLMPEYSSWADLWATTGISIVVLILTILFYACLIQSVFIEEKEDIELELETGASDLIVIKN